MVLNDELVAKDIKTNLQANKKYSYLLLLDYMVTKGKLSVTGYYQRKGCHWAMIARAFKPSTQEA